MNIDFSGVKSYDSFIVNHSSSLLSELVKEQNDFLKKSLNYPKDLLLLFRASENNYLSAAFHQKCDNIPNTLTLVRTEFGKTIAGFTKYTWNSVNAYVSNEEKNCFLLSLDMKQKMVPNNGNNLIYCNPTYGPTFGSGHDLVITNQCQNANSCYANFPNCYNYEGENKYVVHQDTYKAFSGATKGYNFRVIEYEVFRVIW